VRINTAGTTWSWPMHTCRGPRRARRRRSWPGWKNPPRVNNLIEESFFARNDVTMTHAPDFRRCTAARCVHQTPNKNQNPNPLASEIRRPPAFAPSPTSAFCTRSTSSPATRRQGGAVRHQLFSNVARRHCRVREPQNFSSTSRSLASRAGNLLGLDPEHTRLRRSLTPEVHHRDA